MVHLRLTWIFHEEHVAEQPHQSVANPQAVLVALFGKGSSHLALRTVFVTQVVEVISLANQESVANVLGMDAKQTIHQPVVDEGTRKQFLTERQSEVFYLIDGQRQGWREMSQQSTDGIDGNLPDAEEAQHVIDAKYWLIQRSRFWNQSVIVSCSFSPCDSQR